MGALQKKDWAPVSSTWTSKRSTASPLGEEAAVLHERPAGDQDVADGGARGGEGDPVVGIGLGCGPGFGVVCREHKEIGELAGFDRADLVLEA